MAAQLPECRTAGAIAAEVEQGHQLKLSVPTVKRHLRQNGLQHLSPVAKPMLTDRHKLARLRFSKAYLRRDKTSKHRWLNTDSKIFHVHNPLRQWCNANILMRTYEPYCRISCHFQDTANCRAYSHLHISVCCQMSWTYAYMCSRGIHAATDKNKVRMAGNCLSACKDLL